MRQLGFEGYRIDLRTRQVQAPSGDPVALGGKAFEVLLHLVEHRDQIVTKDELLAAVWPGRVIEENTLTQAISLVRRALGSNASDHRYIVTLPGRGYRFVADVQEFDEAPAAAPAAIMTRADPTSAPPPIATPAIPASPALSTSIIAGNRRPLLLAALLLTLALFAIVMWRVRAPAPAITVPATAAPAVAMPATRQALAVLPFRTLGNGPRDELLEAGLADTLITRLSRSSALQVSSLVSAQRFSGAQADVNLAARQLGVAYIVEGSTQRIGDQVRINARLLQVSSGKTLWADTFDARIDRVFTLQDKMGDAVTTALSLAPVTMPRRAISPCDGADADAYRAYLRGYYQLNRPDAARLADALAAFREAIDRDPTCARAWAGTAYAYRALVMTADRDPREMFPLAKSAIARALAIDPDSAEAYSSKGFIEFWYDWDWPRAEASLRHAIALNPNLAEAQIALAHLLVNIGRVQEALPYARKAIALDPLSPLVNSLAGGFIGAAGHKAEARKHIDKTLELEPNSWVALRIRSGRAMARGDHAQAIADLKRAAEISQDSSQSLNLLGKAYVEAGNRPAAEQVLATLEQRRRERYVPATSLAMVVLALGDTERALGLLEQGYRERDVRMSFLLLDWSTLRSEPRYQALLQRMHLPSVGPAMAVKPEPGGDASPRDSISPNTP